MTCHTDSLIPSTCTTVVSSFVLCDSSVELIVHAARVSNVRLWTVEDALYSSVSYSGNITGTGEIKAKETACGDIIVTFVTGSRTHQVTTTR